MAQIKINYEEVYRKTSELKSYIDSDLLVRIDNEYQQLQEALDSVDSATNASLLEAMEQSRLKTRMVALTLDKLLSFMTNSAQQVELNEKKMVGDITGGAKASESTVAKRGE